MEAEPIHDSRHWSVAASEVGLSIVLACVCWLAEFVGTWVLNLGQILAALDRRVPCARCRSLGSRSEASARLWAFAARYRVGCRCAGRKVCVGIELHPVRNSRAVGDGVGVERVASPNRGDSDLLCRKINRRKISQGVKIGKESRSIQCGLFSVQGNH